MRWISDSANPFGGLFGSSIRLISWLIPGLSLNAKGYSTRETIHTPRLPGALKKYGTSTMTPSWDELAVLAVLHEYTTSKYRPFRFIYGGLDSGHVVSQPHSSVTLSKAKRPAPNERAFHSCRT